MRKSRNSLAVVLLAGLAAVALAQTPAKPEASAPPVISPELRELSKIGDSQLEAKNFDAAIATYRRLLDQLSGPREKADVFSRIAEANRRKGDIAESMRALEQAAILVPTSGSILLNIGMLYESQKDTAHAREFYEKAVQLEPNNPLVLNNLAYILSDNIATLDRALSYAVAARRVMPDAMAITDTIGWIYLKKNMPAIAAEQFRTATVRSPNNPEFHYHYAIALNRQGNTSEAAKECQAALAQSPGQDLEASIRRECAGRQPPPR